MMKKEPITVTVAVHAPLSSVWQKWTTPADIQNWNQASDDWHTPSATNDLRAGGKFSYRMAARDGSAAFDFTGVYDQVIENRLIAYTLDDARKVAIRFAEQNGTVLITETFETESENEPELQRLGWQAILNSFKRYAE